MVVWLVEASVLCVYFLQWTPTDSVLLSFSALLCLLPSCKWILLSTDRYESHSIHPRETNISYRGKFVADMCCSQYVFNGRWGKFSHRKKKVLQKTSITDLYVFVGILSFFLVSDRVNADQATVRTISPEIHRWMIAAQPWSSWVCHVHHIHQIWAVSQLISPLTQLRCLHHCATKACFNQRMFVFDTCNYRAKQPTLTWNASYQPVGK